MNNRKISKKQEKQVAKKLNGKVQCNSGATPFYKGDVVSDNFLIECKTSVTEKKGFTVKKDILEKIEQEKFTMGKDYSALCFNFGPNTENYYVITENTLKEFIELERKV